MTYPSPYQPTLKDPLPFYGTRIPGRDDVSAAYGSCIGVSYIGPYINFPASFRSGLISYIWGLTASGEIDNKANLLKKLPVGLRGGRPVILEDTTYIFSHLNESLIDTSKGLATFITGFTSILRNDELRTNLGFTTATSLSPTPWPTQGASAMQILMKSYFQELAKRGATVDFMINDYEGVNLAANLSDSAFNSMLSNSSYYNEWNGVSSWNYSLASYGITANDVVRVGNQPYLNFDSSWAWWKVAQKYHAQAWNVGFYDAIKEVYPKVIYANYDYYEGEKLRKDEALEQNGRPWPQGGYAGNAGSPVLYGRVRQLSFELTSGGQTIRLDDPSYLSPWLTERRTLYNTGPILALSAETSFMQAMMEMKTAKRNAMNSALAPWLSTIYSCGFGEEGHFNSLNFAIGSGQTPPEVLHDHWYPVDVNGNLWDVGGITSYDGSTSAFLVKTSSSSTEAWYKQNISSITFDGATIAYQINTSGVTGITAALAYYLNGGLTSGDTYVFSYFIDASRGFTGLNARFTTWNTSDSPTLAPSLTTTSGITFQQILPVTGPISYRETPIQYNVGDSGWVKVAFQFLGSDSSPRLGLHIYHAANNSPQGYTAFIKDVYLNHQLNGQTRSLGFIGNKDSQRQSLEYYYNGLTSGSTYIFSYYLDLSRSYTGSLALQTINHFKQPLYNLPIGITYNQILPAVRNSLFHTAGMCYGAGTGWTKFAYSFNIPVGNTYDPQDQRTVAISIFKTDAASVMDADRGLGGLSFYIASPTFEIQSSPTNILLPLAPINYETITRWQYGPPIGWCDSVKGPNRRYNVYLTKRAGNTYYLGELVRHCCLSGTAKFGLFNPLDYINYGLTGSIKGYITDVNGAGYAIYRASGLTQHVESFRTLDSVLRDVHEKIKGFTTTTAEASRVNWLAPYIASGAPDTTGQTWWWRITALPGYTTYCGGVTLSVKGNIGTWIGTTGPTLANANIFSTKWTKSDYPPEPNITAPTKQFNFAGMTNINQLVAAGFTFSRGSTASYIDSTGKIAFAGPNQPRFDHDENTLQPLGLLMESAHTNLLNWSESFASTGGSQNNWNNINLSRTSGFTSPSGIASAIRFTATGANGTLISSSPVGSNSFRSFSIFLRGISGTENVSYTIDGGTSWTPISGTTFSIINGQNITEIRKTSGPTLSTSWKRFVFGPTSANHHVGIRLGNSGDAIEIWGAQLESRTFDKFNQRKRATTYIPTTSTTVSTSADSCSISGTSFSSWYGNTYGSFVLEFRNAFDNYPLTLRKDNNNYFWLSWNNLATNIPMGINGVLTNNFCSTNFITQEPCADIGYKVIMTYSPLGVKYESYEGSQTTQTIRWPGNTVGPPEVNSLVMTTNDSLNITNLRYWPFVFDTDTMNQMGKGNVDRSLAMFGGWND